MAVPNANALEDYVFSLSRDDLLKGLDVGKEGSYLSNTNGTDIYKDGLDDTHYVIYANNEDRYPFMNSVTTLETRQLSQSN